MALAQRRRCRAGDRAQKRSRGTMNARPAVFAYSHDSPPDGVVAAVRAASGGDGTVRPDLLGRLLDKVGRLQRQVLAPRGLTFSGLTDREVEVLRLVADGLDTAGVAHKLSYSERTVK